MSILEIPRIYFHGKISWDPIVTNNIDTNYNEDKCESIYEGRFVGAANVDAFRKLAIKQVGTYNWNPDGTHRAIFYDTYISGVDTGCGTDTTDKFVSAPVSLDGKLVDTEPYGTYSSQLFFDSMSFGIDGGCRISGKRVTRFTDRYINFRRNPSNDMIAGVASVMWQTCFDKQQGLSIDSCDSIALQALKAQMSDDSVRGVMVRWVAYRTVYFDDATLSNSSPATQEKKAELMAKLNAGCFQPNPARSLLVGTVGIWRKGEPVHEAGDRALLSTMNSLGNGAIVGTAYARVSKNSITLDLSNTMPDASRAPEKMNLGKLALTAAQSPPVEVATIDFDKYDQAAYEASSGILEIPLADGMESLKNLNLELSGSNGTYLVEEQFRAIPSEPNRYIDEGQSTSTCVQVYDRGGVAGAGIKVTMSELGASQKTHMAETTDENGQVSFQLVGSTPSVTGLVFQPGDSPMLPVTELVFNPLIFTYMYLRILPSDADIAAKEATWANVHDFVMSNWQAMAPCMDQWLDLGDEAQIKSHATIIKKLTDPNNFESSSFMPVTRDMTPGQRTLLYNWLDGASVESSLSVEEVTDYGKLSRAMRG